MLAIRQQKTTVEVQQELAESSGRKKYIIWDFLVAEQSEILQNKLKNLIPDQEKGQKAITEIREILFERIWEQRKYTNRQSLTAIIYVLVAKQTTPENAKKATSFSCHPVFRTRKCKSQDDSSHCCMIFIDETGRVYQNWEAYLSNNVLPKGTMIAPARGVYTFDDNDKVQLKICDTPATEITKVVLEAADTGMAITGLAAATVSIAGMAMTVAAPVILGAAAVGLTTAAYTTVRSSLNLFDRSKHDQSISLVSQQARSSWLGVFGGIVGLGAAGATRALTMYATTGREISTVVELVVNGMNISSIVLSGTGMANGILDLILKSQNDEDITAMDVLQLSASLLLFTHSMYNFQLASNIINSARDAHINSYSKELSNRQRRMFDKLSKETIRIRGNTQGRMDIIRNINEIPSKQYLNDLYKVNKQLNQQKVRPAFTEKGSGTGITLNNEVKVDTQHLRSNINLLKQVNNPIPDRFQGTSKTSTNTLSFIKMNNIDENGTNVQVNIETGLQLINATLSYGTALIKLRDFGQIIFDHINSPRSFTDLITTLIDNYGEPVLRFFLRNLENFMYRSLDKLERLLSICISTEDILYQMIKSYLQENVSITMEYLEEHIDEILEKVKQHFLSMNPNSDKTPTKCDVCNGYFVTVDL